MNLIQGKINVNRYAIKFHYKSLYSLDLVSSLRAKMRKSTLALSRDLVLECEAALLNSDMNISKLVVNMQQVENKEKKKSELRKRQSKRSPYSQQGSV